MRLSIKRTKPINAIPAILTNAAHRAQIAREITVKLNNAVTMQGKLMWKSMDHSNPR